MSAYFSSLARRNSIALSPSYRPMAYIDPAIDKMSSSEHAVVPARREENPGGAARATNDSCEFAFQGRTAG